MDSSQKQVGSDHSSSDENEVKELDTSSAKRSYECTFCKRGFTNAQALGGHMNIHRKDRAKAKQTTGPSFITSNPMLTHEDYMNPRYIAPISSDTSRHSPVFESQRNYLRYYQPSASNPRNPPAYNVPRSESLSMMNEDQLLGANLSLGIGPSCVDEDNEVMRRGTVEEAGLDLELRLGRNR